MAGRTSRQTAVSTTGGAIRLAGLAGTLSIGLGVAGAIIDEMWTFPSTSATATEVAAFFSAHRSTLTIAMVLSTAAVWLWLIFGLGVWLRLRETSRREAFLPVCFLVGLVGFVTLLFAGFAASFVLIYGAPLQSDQLLYDLAFGLLAISGAPTALALGAYASEVLREACLPRWTGSVAAVVALAHLVLISSLLIPSGFFSLEGGVMIAVPATLFAWVMSTSIALLRVRAGGRSAS